MNKKMSKFFYQEGDIVECVNVTEDNFERLVVGKNYMVVGAELNEEGEMIYMLIDIEGYVVYSIDRFKIVSRIS